MVARVVSGRYAPLIGMFVNKIIDVTMVQHRICLIQSRLGRVAENVAQSRPV